MIVDLVQIRRLGESKRGENERFRRHLKSHVFVERRFRRIAEEVEDQIDCRQCANCCKVATVRLTERDIQRLSRFLRLKPAQFIKDYAEESPEEGLILRRSEQGCIFLDGNECSIYEDRPDNCHDFPHLLRGRGSLLSRMWEMTDRACYCPIVYNTLEAWKADVNFSPRPR
ncbi:MAG: YkgJ family cysteine cluster protein [Bryobacteraceae bacterium]|nr:YkgJ family cysteine cluster protein [Bryobacteraceae bacterium]